MKKQQTNKTRKIAGTEITLEAGRRYYASRPVYTGKEAVFTVSIHDITATGLDAVFNSKPVAKFPGLSYDAANRLLARFNNGTTSFEGRVW